MFFEYDDFFKELGKPDHIGPTKKKRSMYYFKSLVMFKRTKASYPKYEIRKLKFEDDLLIIAHTKTHDHPVARHINEKYLVSAMEKALLGDESD